VTVRLPQRVSQVRREREAAKFDYIADQIESGALIIRGAAPGPVRDRMRDKANRARAGQRVIVKGWHQNPDPS
jgi:hypothetical protein